MTKEQLKNLTLNQRVSMWCFDLQKTWTIYGIVTKIYNGNWQVQVWFDGEASPRVVGYSRIEICTTN